MNNATEEKYIVHGPASLVNRPVGTAGQLLFKALKRYSHLPAALVNAETQQILSYKELLDGSCRVASSFVKCGLNAASVVAILSENSIFYLYPVLASLFLGVAAAPLSPDYVDDELNHAVSISKPQVLFCSQKTRKKAIQLQKTFSFIQKLIVLDSEIATEGVQTITCFMDKSIDTNLFKPVGFGPHERVALILCSSGTTGLPKGAMITHKNLSVKLTDYMDPIVGIVSKPETTVLSVVPLYHITGIGFNLAYLAFGFRIIIMNRYSPQLFLKAIQDYQAETCFIVPPIMVFLAKSPLVHNYDLSSLKDIGCGAAPLSEEIAAQVVRRLPALREFRQGYGLTESTSAVTYTPRGDAKIGSSGTLYPRSSAKVIDLSTGIALGPYQKGELCFKGEYIMKGYVGKQKETEDIIDKSGWLHSGDFGYYDEDYHFYVVDRIKEIIKYKGFQIPPAELEALLLKHPKIKDAGVIGIKDNLVGEIPRAYVVKQPNETLTEEEVFEFVGARISRQKQLRGGVVFVEEIPRIASGKIARRILREMSQMRRSKL